MKGVQQELEEGRDQSPKGPHGAKPQAQRPAAIGAIGMLGHDHRREDVVGADAYAQDEAQADQPGDVGGEGLGDRRRAQDQHVDPIEALAAPLSQDAEP